jgi:hypothetical protein
MNREQAKKVAPILAAFAEGKEIEYRSDFSSKWVKVGACLVHQCLADSPDSYRIKPEPEYEWDVTYTRQGIAGTARAGTLRTKYIHSFATQEAAEVFSKIVPSPTITKREIKDES